MAQRPRGTVTLLFTDIEGSTRLLTRLGDRYADVLAAHHRILRDAIARHAGHEVGTEGDAFFVAFARAGDAVAAAVAAQRALASHAWPGGVEVLVRMGLHTGEPALHDGQYVGLDVHRAARICAAAHGGQVLVSQPTARLVDGAGAERVVLADLGEHRLKDLGRPERLFQVHTEGLRARFPPVASGGSAAGAAALPALPNPTIGREADVVAVARRLEDRRVRLLTLTGPGGVGKTRLAIEAARAAAAVFADGARFVALAPVASAHDVPDAVVQALAVVPVAPERPEEALVRFLGSKDLLLVLDNLEHVVDAVPLVAMVLDACPGVTVLATSREPLGLGAEERHPVDPLALPAVGDGPGAVLEAPAAALFAERVRAHDPAFAVTGATAGAVAEICRRLDGLPLAIELAAARCTLLSPAEVAQRLDAALSVLGEGPRDAPTRHRTLRATIDWSFDLLEQPERDAATAFAAFAGGATVDAAQAVTGAGLDTLQQLVAKSLLVRRPSGATTRLRMLEPVRAYAGERLAGSPRAGEVAERHHRRLLEHARRHGAERMLWGAEGTRHLAMLAEEEDDLQAALRWAVEQGDGDRALAMAAALGTYWLIEDRYGHAVEWIDRALALAGPDPDLEHLVHVLCAKGRALLPLGREREDEAVFRQAEAVARRSSDPSLLAHVLHLHADRQVSHDHLALADALAQEAAAAAEAAGDAWELAGAAFARATAATTLEELDARVERAATLLDRVGNVYVHADLLSAAAYAALCLGGDVQARALTERAAPLTRVLGRPYQRMMLQGNAGLAALLTGDPDRAAEAFREELAIARDLAIPAFAGEALSGLAGIAAAGGSDGLAARLYGASSAHRARDAKDALESRLDALLFGPARERLGATAWDAAVDAGSRLGAGEALAVAAGMPDPV